MKTLVLKSIFILLITCGFTTKTTLKEVVYPINAIAVFDGYDDLGYNFSFVNDEDEDVVLAFKVVPKKFLKQYDLKDDKFIGNKFEITYEYQTSEEDEMEVFVLKEIKIIE